MAFGLMTMGIRDAGEIGEQVKVIGTSLDEIFEEAAQANASPMDAAATRVGGVLAEARAEQGFGPELAP